jgi:hypothetical protein
MQGGLFGERMTDLKRGTPDWVHAGRTPEGLGPLGSTANGAADDVPPLKLAGIHTSPHATAAKVWTARALPQTMVTCTLSLSLNIMM